MAKSKNKKRAQPSSGAPKPSKATTPRQRGMEFFRQRNYLEAARQWEELPLENDDALAGALAEAHFRRALDAQGHPAAIEALRAALQIRPDDARFLTHLALALHRDDQLEAAQQFHAQLMQTDARPNVQHARALAAIEANPSLDLSALPWLSGEVRALVEPVASLLRDESLPITDVGADEPNATWLLLWRGLGALQRGDDEAARASLGRGKERPLPAAAEQVRAFYYGAAAAKLGKSVAALDDWQEAAQIARKAKIEPLPQLEGALKSVQSGRLPELYRAEQWDGLLREARAAGQLAPADEQPRRALAIALNQLAIEAAREGKWPRAAELWAELRALIEADSNLGPLPPVLHNLALAQENAEDLPQAVALWEELIKATARRGRRKDPSEAEQLSEAREETQREWLRRHVLKLLQQLGDPAPAIEHYKKAIKAAPDDLELRYELAQALVANKQMTAAINETERILERDPTWVEALMLQATIARIDNPWTPKPIEAILRRALKIKPEHETARQALGQILTDEGAKLYNLSNYKGAQRVYVEALELLPNDPIVLAFLAETELRLNKKKQAEERLEALARNGDEESYGQLVALWARQENIARARAVYEHALAQGHATYSLFVTLGSICFEMGDGPDWETWGHELLEKALELAPTPAQGLNAIVDLLIEEGLSDVAVPYMKRLVMLSPDDPDVLLEWALVQTLNQQKDEALETLKQVEKLARQFRDRDLQQRIELLRQQINSPGMGLSPFGALSGLLGDLPEFDFD